MQWYSRGRSLINPKHFALKELGFLKLGVIVFIKRVYEWMRTTAGDVTIEKHDLGARSFFAIRDGLGVFHSYFGAPASVLLAEALIISGVKRLVVFGEAGAIHPKMRIGDILIPTFAVREEGTSYHYLPYGVSAGPSQKLLRKLKYLLDKTGFTYEEGGIWTTDAPLRETRQKVLTYGGLGVLAVDMECSALFAVSKYRRVECVAMLTISDELYGRVWKQGFDSEKLIDVEKKLVDVLMGNWHGLL
ncbi:MAG: nucleoside phosphorylase [Candidatus Bathyarchaeia archaeon]